MAKLDRLPRDPVAAAKISGEKISKMADERARKMLPFAEEAWAAGVPSLNGIAGYLNNAGLKTVRKKEWLAVTVKHMLDHLPS